MMRCKNQTIVVQLKPRDLYDMGEGDGEVYEVELCSQQDLNKIFSNFDQLALSRDDELLNKDNNDDELHENDSMSE